MDAMREIPAHDNSSATPRPVSLEGETISAQLKHHAKLYYLAFG
eukprot:CAMPEP_0180653022 /NCGR_PEP_ID=MMETSP1037_2-20121125/53834_1 /TAXON_ID=632150 /ORGANISM="Azadinium spinosum, Strain 3D9" /LENGTH=43 /DNA_ID= /DNA_START= /DNA_END= /DNA_ORIENTATION=